jgi:(p)ppGpp synthase/HD superfamily hydrolase
VYEEPFLKDCLQLAKAAHQEQYRASGDSFIEHPKSVATLYSRFHPSDLIGIGASLIHDVVEDSRITLLDIKNFLGKPGREIASMVGALSKKPRYQFRSQHERQQEYLGRLFRGARLDHRVGLIKVADRYNNLTTVECLEQHKALRILKETEEVLIAFFAQLNLPLTRELSELCCQKLRLVQFQTGTGGARALPAEETNFDLNSKILRA